MNFNAVSIDCPNMIQFAYELGMQNKQPAIWTQLQSDCCSTGGITCTSQRVTQIDWSSMELNGTINGTAIPPSLTELSLYSNAVIGNIPKVLPSSLVYLTLARNLLTGSIPSALPSGLLELYLDGNQMNGDLPSFPPTLQNLILGYPGNPGNHFTGSLKLNRPIEVYINYNWIADVVIQDSSQINPGSCQLSNNPLLGNPNIAGLTMCTYSAGVLPVTRSTITLGSSTKVDGAVMTIGSTQIINGTQSDTLEKTSTLVAVQFAPMTKGFSFDLFMVVRLIVSVMILSTILNKSPFMRELNRMIKKKTKETSTTEF